MQFSINKAILLGNITKDPELRYTPNGTAVCSFSIATNHGVKKGDSWEQVGTFHNIVSWSKLAENVAKNYAKGAKVYVEGRIQTDKYVDKQGVTKYTTKIVAENVIGFSGVGGGHSESHDQTDDGQQPPEGHDPNAQDVSEDIPF